MSNSSFPATDVPSHFSSDEQAPVVHSSADPTSSAAAETPSTAPPAPPSTEPASFDNIKSEPAAEARKIPTDTATAVAQEIQSKLSLSRDHSLKEHSEAPSTGPMIESTISKEAAPQDLEDAASDSSFTEASEKLEEQEKSEEEKHEDIDPELSRRIALRERMAKMSGGLGMHAFGLPGMAPPPRLKSLKKGSEPESEYQPINDHAEPETNPSKPRDSAAPSGMSSVTMQASPEPSTNIEETVEPNADDEASNTSLSASPSMELPGLAMHIPGTEESGWPEEKEQTSPPPIITDFSNQKDSQVEEVLPLSQTHLFTRLKPPQANSSSIGQSPTSIVDPAHAVRKVIDSIDPPKETVAGTAADVESAANSPVTPPRSLNSREQSPDWKDSYNNNDFAERKLPSRITEVSESQAYDSDAEVAPSQRSSRRPSLPSIRFNKTKTIADFNEDLDDLPAVPRIFSPPPLPKTPSGEFGDSEFIQPKRQLKTKFIPGHQSKPSTGSSLRNPVSISTSGGRPVLSDEPDEPDTPDSLTEHPLPALPVSDEPVEESNDSMNFTQSERRTSIIAPTPSVPVASPPPIPVAPVNTEPKAPSISPPPIPNTHSEQFHYDSTNSSAVPASETNQNNSLTQDITQLGNSMRLPTRLVRPSSSGRKASGPRPVAPPSIPPPPPVSVSKSEISKEPVPPPAPTSSPPVPPPLSHQVPPAPSAAVPPVPPPTTDVPPIPVSPFSQDVRSSSSESVPQSPDPIKQEVSPTTMPQRNDSVSQKSISSISIRQAPDMNPPLLSQRPSQKSIRSTASVKRPSIVATNGPFNDAYVAKIVDPCAEQKWWLDSSTVPNSVLKLNDSVLFMIREGTTGPNKHFKSIHILFHDYSQTVLTSTFNPATHYVTQLSQLQLAPPVQPSKERLAQEFECYGNTILRQAKASQGLTIGDGSAYTFVNSILGNLTQNIEPINKRTFGAVVYANDSNVTIQQNGEIRPGDIITFDNVRLSGQKGTLRHKYAFDVGNPFHVGIVAEWEVSKMKIRALEQGRESKKVSLVSYKLGDLKSGEITVWRTMRRSWLGWN
ncbi:WIP protein [Schizosaccharomyces cryophilus OY26]|uniref:WIP protein n=1 Tax=Schizosaccharomyces cryophilus (strain OY26 / ATCC MYA-4695 / CBS 11777 / NBRC 106824 / NRRL Y48691) TaxID=653667 RepID=S9W070_SCHCR|nr:WIP protein [Schizosaccharomyces cryophilus OY26]EPY51440.1 WIP protein [Schizosaccharomyces cryophilus OY26]